MEGRFNFQLIKKYLNMSMIFNILIVYYWTLFNMIDPKKYEPAGLPYLFQMVPIGLFMVLGYKYIFGFGFNRKMRPFKVPIQTCMVPLLYYLGLLFVINIIKGSYEHFFSSLFFIFPLLIVINADIRINLRLLNTLFLINILLAVISYYFGYNSFGFFPGQATAELNTGMWWRISIFPFQRPPASGVFALLVFGSNYLQNSNKLQKVVMLTVSLYFLLLSGNRTVLILFFYFIIFFIIKRIIKFKNTFFYTLFPFLTLALTISVIFSPFILSSLNIENDIVRGFLFKSRTYTRSDTCVNNRAILIEKNFSYFSRNIKSMLLGNGESFFEQVSYIPASRTGSEERLFYLLARDGISTLVFVYFLFGLFGRYVRDENLLGYLVLMCFLFFMVFYASFLNSNNFIYLIILGLLNPKNSLKWKDPKLGGLTTR
jgi:hypothetical protein